jgi:DNA mismatch repair protein MutL
VHPAKTEVRFRRAAAVADAVREAVREALASAGYARGIEAVYETVAPVREEAQASPERESYEEGRGAREDAAPYGAGGSPAVESSISDTTLEIVPPARQGSIEFGFAPPADEAPRRAEWGRSSQPVKRETARDLDAILRHAQSAPREATAADDVEVGTVARAKPEGVEQNETSQSAPVVNEETPPSPTRSESQLPPLVSAASLVREVALDEVSTNIRPLGQLEESFIIATDDEGLLLIDQHVAHERILFDKYRRLEASRPAESQQLLLPETFDLTPAQAAAFDTAAEELETYGFGLMRLSGRTVAVRAVPADLPAGEARNVLAEVLETVDAEKRGAAHATLRERVAASLACRAAIKINTPLAPAKMRWLIDRLLLTSSPTTCPHGRPVILRLTTRDIEKGFHRS